jgi:hypothetical protein
MWGHFLHPPRDLGRHDRSMRLWKLAVADGVSMAREPGGHRSSATRSGSGGFAAEAYAMWWVRGDSARQRAAACLRLVRHQWRAWAWRQPAALTGEVQALRGAMRVKDRGWPRAFDGPLSSPCNECCGLRLWWAAAMAR